MTTNKHYRKEGRSANIGFAKWRVSCFYDSLVQGSSSVFQLNICAENRHLRKAANRYNVERDLSLAVKLLPNIFSRFTAPPSPPAHPRHGAYLVAVKTSLLILYTPLPHSRALYLCRFRDFSHRQPWEAAKTHNSPRNKPV